MAAFCWTVSEQQYVCYDLAYVYFIPLTFLFKFQINFNGISDFKFCVWAIISKWRPAVQLMSGHAQLPQVLESIPRALQLPLPFCGYAVGLYSQIFYSGLMIFCLQVYQIVYFLCVSILLELLVGSLMRWPLSSRFFSLG